MSMMIKMSAVGRLVVVLDVNENWPSLPHPARLVAEDSLPPRLSPQTQDLPHTGAPRLHGCTMSCVWRQPRIIGKYNQLLTSS